MREDVVTVGPPAHGGHCVARLPAADGDEGAGRVVFVRHALPGERVRIRITEGRDRDRFWRADAIEVIEASPDRVTPPCPLARPGGCGGCDLQHVSLAAQRVWKAEVVTDLLRRLGGLGDDVPRVTVEAVAVPDHQPDDGLRWRTRTRFAVERDGRLGYRRHRSRSIIAVEDCPITTREVLDTGVTARRWPGAGEVAVAAGDDGRLVRVVTGTPVPPGAASQLPPDGWSPPATSVIVDDGETTVLSRRGRSWVRHTVQGIPGPLRVSGEGFWQAHAGVPPVYVAAVREVLALAPGDRAIDLYAGVGLFAAALAQDVGPAGDVIAVEGEARAVADARRNLHDQPQVRIVHAAVAQALASHPDITAPGTRPAAGVVLDPPRSGAGADVVAAIAGLAPAAIAYVSCDPAALARDVALLATRGYRLTSLRAFDAFPMTAHVECVAGFTPADPSGPGTP